jgi:single-strand DNA-binding protein
MSVNKVILVGNVGKDPDVKYLDNGTAFAKFPLATSETYNNRNGEKVEQTEWHNIVVWRGLAQVVEKYVRKGALLYIEGKIRTRSYDDSTGNKRYITEIVVDNMTMLGRRGNDQAEGTPSGSEHQSTGQQQNQNQPQSSADNNKPMPEDPFADDSDGADDLPF